MSMRLGISIGLSYRGAAGSAPAWQAIRQSLFGSSEPGGLYQVHPDYCRQGNTEGSTAAAVDSVVGWLQDHSGNGQHLTQSTTAAMPILRSDGTLYWLELDGVNDEMIAGTGDITTVMLAAAVQLVGSSGGIIGAGGGSTFSGIASFGTGGSGVRFRHQDVTSDTGLSGPWTTNPIVTIARADDQADNFIIDNTAYTGTTLGAGNSRIAIGVSGASNLGMKFYGGIVRAGVVTTDEERGAVKTWLASLQGRVL